GAAGVDKDKTKAFSWYLMAAKAGDKGAQKEISLCFYVGTGVEQSYQEYSHWNDYASKNTKEPLQIKFDLSLPLLHRAAEYGQVALVKSLMEQLAMNVDLRDRH